MSEGRLAILGPGRIGRSLALDLEAAGLFRSVDLLGRDDALTDGRRVPDPLLFCVPDDALAGVAARAAATLKAAGAPPGRALHTSGLHPAEILAPLREEGWSVGSWHPLRAIAAPRAEAFRGAAVGLEGDPEAVALGERLARAVGARPLRVRPDRKDRYHAGAVFGANFVAACLAVALREVRAACEDDARLEDLLPLARSALEGLAAAGLPAGLTGPVARGDAGTVARHLAALDAPTRSLYRALAAELLRAARAELEPAAAERLARLLEPAEAARSRAEPAPS